MTGAAPSPTPAARLVARVRQWPDVRVDSQPGGDLGFWLAEGELGQLHPAGRLDVPVGPGDGGPLVRRGVVRPHPQRPNWVSCEVTTSEHGTEALALLVRAYLHLTAEREWMRAPPGRST